MLNTLAYGMESRRDSLFYAALAFYYDCQAEFDAEIERQFGLIA